MPRCEDDTTTRMFKASIYPSNLHFFQFYSLSFASAASIYSGAVHSVHGQILLHCSWGNSSFIHLKRRHRRGVEGPPPRQACSVIITQLLYRLCYCSVAVHAALWSSVFKITLGFFFFF